MITRSVKFTHNKVVERTHPAPIPVNPALVWDYDIPAESTQSEAFRRWYLARVLTRGSADDLRTVKLRTIYEYFPDLNLPAKIRRFWQWYFNLPEVKARYEPADVLSSSNNSRNR